MRSWRGWAVFFTLSMIIAVTFPPRTAADEEPVPEDPCTETEANLKCEFHEDDVRHGFGIGGPPEHILEHSTGRWKFKAEIQEDAGTIFDNDELQVTILLMQHFEGTVPGEEFPAGVQPFPDVINAGDFSGGLTFGPTSFDSVHNWFFGKPGHEDHFKATLRVRSFRKFFLFPGKDLAYTLTVTGGF